MENLISRADDVAAGGGADYGSTLGWPPGQVSKLGEREVEVVQDIDVARFECLTMQLLGAAKSPTRRHSGRCWPSACNARPFRERRDLCGVCHAAIAAPPLEGRMPCSALEAAVEGLECPPLRAFSRRAPWLAPPRALVTPFELEARCAVPSVGFVVASSRKLTGRPEQDLVDVHVIGLVDGEGHRPGEGVGHASDFSPCILHDVRSVAAQVAFVGCGQGIALVPSSTRKLAPETVMLRPLVEEVEIVTTAAAWSSTSVNPAVQAAVEVLRSIADGVGSEKSKRASRRASRP